MEIIYKLGAESHVVVEEKETFKTSIFSDVYTKVDAMIQSYTGSKLQRSEEPNNDKKPDNDPFNNIIAFFGERGSGKTSCMLSVRQAWIKRENVNLLALDVIDPSFFEEGVNILALVVANMFNWFKQQYEEKAKCKSIAQQLQNQQEKIISNFATVQKNIAGITGNETEGYDHLNQLVEKASSVELKKNMGNLIEALLDFAFPGKNKNEKFMLISIDDLDLNTRYAYPMVEQIRKYLIHPHVILLMAAKLKQLKNIIKTQYRNEFNNHSYVTDEEVDEMADKYLSKLIPLHHRAYLPEIELSFNDTLIIKDEQGKDLLENTMSLKETVLSLIFEKTRFLFYNSAETPSPIIPANLRELITLIRLLIDMKSSIDFKKYNQALFLNYFFQTWIPNHLDEEGQHIMEGFRKNKNVIHINKYLVTALKNKFSHYKDFFSQELKLISNESNIDYNLSLGDVLLFIRTLDNLVIGQQDTHLLFAIKSYYSILLYRYYDDMTEPPANRLPAINRLYKQDPLNQVGSYTKLVGGNFINANSDTLLPAKRTASNKPVSRSCTLINGALLMEVMNQLNESFLAQKPSQQSIRTVLKNKTGAPTTDDNTQINITYNKSYRISRSEAVIISEFFALCTDMPFDPGFKNYRLKEDVCYRNHFSKRQSNIRFHITSFLYNIICYKEAIERYPYRGLADRIMNHPDSIYQAIKTFFRQRYDNENPDSTDEGKHRWKSWTCIRNIEILEDMLENMIEGKPRLEESELGLYSEFFTNIGTENNQFIEKGDPDTNRKKDYYIYTYDIEQTNENIPQHYRLSFGYARCIGKKLKKLEANRYENAAKTQKKGIMELFEDILRFNETENVRLSIKDLYLSKTNKNETIRRKIAEQYPEQFSEEILRKRFPDGKYTWKKEAENILNELADQNG